MQMPSTVQVSSANFSGSMERNIANNNNSSLHNKVANFVLDLQTDVRLEDLLDNNENANVNNVQATQHIPVERKDAYIKHLKHLYHEIKNQQNSVINGHEQSGKRRQAENSSGFGRKKTMRNSDFLLINDTDCVDETWLLNFASQLGLDKKMELPELNCDFMQEFL